ncbi:MAG: hypothetical protein GY888_14090, partial [Planctomycetaceae bacterium]|nr:hypothetical protein [Planctomycetaceae bacterium]
MNGNQMMNRLFWLVCVVFLPGLLSGQEVRRVMIEEIQVVPTEAKGKWTIGGQVFGVLPTTQINAPKLPVAGEVAAVQYLVKDAQLVATIIQPMGIKAADVNDGPYVTWKDASTAEVLMLTAGKVSKKTYQQITKPIVIDDLPGLVKSITLDPAAPASPRSTWTKPSSL